MSADPQSYDLDLMPTGDDADELIDGPEDTESEADDADDEDDFDDDEEEEDDEVEEE